MNSPRPLPVSVLVARTTRGPSAPLATWAENLGRAAAAMPGHLATHVNEEHAGARVTVRVGVTFASAGDLLRWERSPTRRHLLAEVDEITEGQPHAFMVNELDHWTPRGPSKLRMTLLIWIALFPIALLMNHLVMPALDHWPVFGRTLLLTGVLVPTVVLVTLPLLNWLIAARAGWRRAGPHRRPA